MISGCIAVPDKDPKTWRSRGRKKRPVIACAAIVTPPPLKKRLRQPLTPPQRSIIVEPKRRPNSMLAHLLEEITPEEHRRRGELADELFRTIVRRAQQTAAEKTAIPGRSYAGTAAPEASGRVPEPRQRSAGLVAPSPRPQHVLGSVTMTELDIVIPGPEIDSDPDAVALWEKTGKFIGTALAGMDREKVFSIMLGRLQHELRDAYGAENARKVLQAILDTME